MRIRIAFLAVFTLWMTGITATWAGILPDETFAPLQLPAIQLQPDEEVLVSAFSLMGTPYRPGGESPQTGGFDCSGFVRFVYQQAGLDLPARSSRELFSTLWGQVSRDSLQPGDLVFFGSRHGINHVGIYVGNDRFIHAPARGGSVRVDNLNDAYWQRYYSGARRVLAG